MKTSHALLAAGAVALTLAAGFAWAQAQHGMGQGMHGMGMHGMGGMGQGMHGMGMGGGMGMTHMLQGIDTDETEVEDMRALFLDHPAIRRSVVNLPDGIETLTESDDPALAEAILRHVAGMIGRVEDNRDPRVPIQSPTLDLLFANRALIRTGIVPTETGVRVTQRSDDAATVAALQTHAAEVSDMAARGMQSVHARMMGAPRTP
ncbi:MAG: hypothetical protein ACK4S2_06730 [Gemmobacter sp.]|uniref:hypothetical protein n=1 Tax=Gemmobacter sp. TaxID=1898957 RepID=UPI00391965FF